MKYEVLSMSRGGKRVGSGRPRLYKSPTRVVRLPIDEIISVKKFLEDKNICNYSPKIILKLLDMVFLIFFDAQHQLRLIFDPPI
jgi:hypothetical protein